LLQNFSLFAMKIDFQKILPHILCITLFYIVTFAYFQPEFLDNKALYKYDIAHYEGGAREVRDYNKTHDEPTLWTGAMFSGMPVYLLEAPTGDYVLTAIDKTFKGLFLYTKDAGSLFVALLATYLALLCFGVSPYLAAVGALSFGFSTYHLVIISVGHMTKMWALSYAPLVLGGMYLTLTGEDIRKKVLGFGVFSLALALELRANHPQITYYLFFICVILGINQLIVSVRRQATKPFITSSALLLAGAMLAVGSYASKLLPTTEYSKYSTRGTAELSSAAHEKGTNAEKQDGLSKEYAFGWSQGKAETLTLLIPNLYGGSSNEKLDKNSEVYQTFMQAAQGGQMDMGQANQYVKQFPLYWGDQPFTAAPVYAGAIVCFLFVLGLIFLENDKKYWLLAGVILMFMISWGKNLAWFNYPLFDYFPMFNKFRSVSMALSLAVLLMVIGGILGLDKALKTTFSAEQQKNLLIAFGATGGFALVIWLLGSSLFSFSSPSDEQFGGFLQAVIADRKSMLRADALRSFLFIAAVTGIIWATWNKKISQVVALSIIGFLSMADVWAVSKRYVNDEDFKPKNQVSNRQATEADNFILQDKDLSYRVLNFANPFNDSETSYFHKSVGGYFAAKLRRYQELYERQLEKQMQQIGKDLSQGQPAFEKYNVVNMLNARYLKFGDSPKEVLKNPTALGNAWFVSKLKNVNSADEEMAALDSLPTATTAVIDGSKFKTNRQEFAVDSTATIRLTAYSPKELSYESNNSQDGFAVFSEVFYPEGWEVSIDGQPAQFVRVNYVLRGLEIPKGKHTIKAVFNPSSYRTGVLLTQICSALIVFLCAASVAWSLKK